jgi:hypothetical protein
VIVSLYNSPNMIEFEGEKQEEPQKEIKAQSKDDYKK